MFFNFIITNSKRYVISKTDILVEGGKCRDLIVAIKNKIQDKDIKSIILLNKINKILCLIEKTNEIVMTKFIDSIWLKYNFYSELGDQFLTLDEIKKFFPYLTDEELITDKNLEKEYQV